MGAAFLVLGAVSRWRGHELPPRVLWTLGGALLVAGLVFPGHLSGVHRSWMALASAISKVTAPIMIGAVYFLVLTPAGLLMRVAGRNPIRQREHDGGFWQPALSDGRSDLETLF